MDNELEGGQASHRLHRAHLKSVPKRPFPFPLLLAVFEMSSVDANCRSFVVSVGLPTRVMEEI